MWHCVREWSRGVECSRCEHASRNYPIVVMMNCGFNSGPGGGRKLSSLSLNESDLHDARVHTFVVSNFT